MWYDEGMSGLAADFVFAPSRWAAVLMGAGAAVALASVFIIPIPPGARGVGAVLLGVAFFWEYRRVAALKGRGAVGGVTFVADRMVAVSDRRGERMDSGRAVYCYVSAWMAVAVIRGSRRRYTVWVLPDSLPAREFRHFRIRLKALAASAAAF